MISLTASERTRYSRHLLLPEVGIEGQVRLKSARVLIVGLGGLGCPVSLYLAAAGVGTLGLVDFDRVDESNLQRQLMYGTSDVGRFKTEVAQRRLEDVNPHIAIELHNERLTSANALELVEQYDVVVDGTDNFTTRYLVNDACVLVGRPNVYGSIFRFEGQASVFWPPKGPCYRCLFPQPPPPGTVPSCAEGGVLGILPGMIGILQANEIVKIILGIGTPLIGRLVLYDALGLRFREVTVRRDPRCPLCGEQPTIRELIAYEGFCELPAATATVGFAPLAVDEITCRELKRRFDAGEPILLLDVREPAEFAICRIESSVLIPLNELPNRVGELDAQAVTVVHCKSGARSQQAAGFLKQQGFTNVSSLAGGIIAWAQDIDPSMPTY